MKAHYVEIRSFAQATESRNLVEEAMRTFLPPETEVEVHEAEGHFGNPVKILSARFENADEIRNFLERIEPFTDRLLEELDRRLDEDCNLWMRFDKAAALEGEVKPVKRDGIVAKMKVEAYPAKRENAVENARKILQAPS